RYVEHVAARGFDEQRLLRAEIVGDLARWNTEQVRVLRSSIIRRQSSGYRQTTSERLRALGCALQLRVSNLQKCRTEKVSRLPAQSRASSYFDALPREPELQFVADFAFAR